MKEPSNLSETHILKIVGKGKKFRSDVGIKCYPKQTYGVSQQSPEQFKLPHSLIAENGYFYQDEQDRQNKDIYLPYFNQKKFCSVVGNTIDVVEDLSQVYNEELSKSPQRFHKRKGRLSDFMEKNGWMNKVYKLMGFQRTNQARQACNKDRQGYIKSARKTISYKNPVQKKSSLPKQSYINSALISQRAKIRLERLSLQQQKKQALNIQKQMIVTCKKSPQKDKYLDAENLTNNMSSTKNEKQWRSTMATIRKKFRKQVDKQDKLSLTKSDWSTNNRSIQLKPQTSYKCRMEQERIQNKDELKQWFNSTCNSHANPWKYRKALKMATGSDQQILS